MIRVIKVIIIIIKVTVIEIFKSSWPQGELHFTVRRGAIMSIIIAVIIILTAAAAAAIVII